MNFGFTIGVMGKEKSTLLKNYMEDLVELWLPRIFKEDPQKYADVCKCPSCIARIKAEALNRLTPFYVTGKVGEVFGEYQIKEIQYKTDLMVALSGAIESVHSQAHKRAEPLMEPSLQSLATLRKRKGRAD